MSNLLHDLKYAGRVLARDKTFAAATILTLGLCIGAHTTIFTVVNAVLLRPLPASDPDRLVWVANAYPGAGVPEADNSVPDYFDRRQAVPAFESIAMYRPSGRTLGTAQGAERVAGMLVTPTFFRTLGAGALRGRVFEETDGEAGRHQKTVISYALWQQLFGGADEAIGRELRIDGLPHTVIGVMPPGFRFVDGAIRFWLPAAFTPEERADSERHSNNFLMFARLAPGATIHEAQRQLDALNAANLERFPELKEALLNAGFTTRVEPLQDRFVREVRGTLYLLWGGVVFVLLIGCVNVTNLSLVRASARAREFATRQALGAGRWQLMRQLLTESVALTAAAGLSGLVIAYWAVQALVASAADRLPRGEEIAIDAATVAATLVVTLAVGALLALIPLIHVSRGSLAQAVREEGRSGTAGRGARAVRRTLVTAQVAFAFMLLIGAGLLFASFQALLGVQTGFEPGGLISGRVYLPESRYATDSDVVALQQRLLERVRALPGVTAAGLNNAVPFTGSYGDSVIFAEGYVAPPGESVVSPAMNIVAPGYFETMRIPLRSGRFIDARDTHASPAVIVIDERLARRFWGDGDPIGRRMWMPGSAEEVTSPGPLTRWYTIVGVVGAVKQRGLASENERLGAYYFPHTQQTVRTMTVVARPAGDPLALAPAIRRELAALDPEVPLFSVQTMEQRIAESVAGRRTAMTLAVAFGFIALLLATVGVYGVLAYQVTQRTREIGIRIALGSGTGQVFALVLREGAVLLALGFAFGLAGVFAMRRALQAELYGVDAFDPSVLTAVAVLLAVVALIACVLPARRASRIDPVVALAD